MMYNSDLPNSVIPSLSGLFLRLNYALVCFVGAILASFSDFPVDIVSGFVPCIRVANDATQLGMSSFIDSWRKRGR